MASTSFKDRKEQSGWLSSTDRTPRCSCPFVADRAIPDDAIRLKNVYADFSRCMQYASCAVCRLPDKANVGDFRVVGFVKKHQVSVFQFRVVLAGCIQRFPLL